MNDLRQAGVTAPAQGRPISKVRLIGGRACLDFVNTIHDRHAEIIEDYICGPEAYLEWSRRAGLLGEAEAVAAPDAPRGRDQLMLDVRNFREALHALFVSRMDCRPGSSKSVRLLDDWLHRAWADLSLLPTGDLGWPPSSIDARLPLKRIALSALELLQEPTAERLKCCAALGECGWLFYDTSKNNARRWCAMETCGTAHKMARYRSAAL